MFLGADAYDRFMGRYSRLLAPAFADFTSVAPGQRALDVGCGPGALTAVLAERLGSGAVSAVDPSRAFVEAAMARNPEVDVREASAEALPFADGMFDVAMAQLVVHFMADPVQGLREMARVTRDGGVVAACVWDHGGGQGPLAVFWDAARELDASVDDESGRAGVHKGQLSSLLSEAGLTAIEEVGLSVSAEHPDFDEWWEPFTLGIGPAGVFAAGLGAAEREDLRQRCRRRLPPGSFTLTACAWAAKGVSA